MPAPSLVPLSTMSGIHEGVCSLYVVKVNIKCQVSFNLPVCVLKNPHTQGSLSFVCESIRDHYK